MERMKEPCEFLLDGEWIAGFVIEDCGDGFFYVLPAYAVSPFHRTWRLGSHEIREMPAERSKNVLAPDSPEDV